MALKKLLNFSFKFVGDGSTQSVTANLLSPLVHVTDPISAAQVSPSPFPDSASTQSVTADNSQTVSSSSIDSNGIITVNFSTTPGNGAVVTVSGSILF